MSLQNVQLALIAKLKATFLPAWENRIAWENVHFNQPKSGLWMSVHFLPADERIATLGSFGLDTVVGLFQINLFMPTGSGEGTSRETINELRTCFTPQNVLHGGQEVRIVSRGRGPATTTTDSFRIPFTVQWQAQIPRTQ